MASSKVGMQVVGRRDVCQSMRMSSAQSDVEPRSFVDHSNSLLLNLASICSTVPSTSVSEMWALPTLYAPGLTQSWTATRAW